MAFIYKIRNLVNNNLYIGSTRRPKYKRKYEHFSRLRNNKHYNNHLQNVFNKHGESNFIFEILEKVPFSKETNNEEINKELVKREFYFVKLLNPEYNIKKDIVRGQTGYKHSEETKKKISESNLKNHLDKPKKEKVRIRLSSSGWKHTPESINKIRNRSLKEDNKKRIREIQKIASIKRIGTHLSSDSKIKMIKKKFGKMREIMIYNKKGEFVNKCNFSSEASVLTGVKRSNISNNLAGISKSAGDYIFKYTD